VSEGHTNRHRAHHGHAHDHRSASRRALLAVLVLTLAFTIVEVVGGLFTDSLALLADAGHMVSDVLAIGLALVALTLARRPSSPRRSFGFQRAEILAAFVNGLALVLVSGWIVWEAVGRLDDPPEILGGWMLVVALAGLLVNAAAAAILMRSGHESLNVEAAFRHVVADFLGSAGVLVAGVVSGGPADSAGISAGDLITAIDGHTITSRSSLTSRLLAKKPGAKVTVTYMDQFGAGHSVRVTLASGPPQ